MVDFVYEQGGDDKGNLEAIIERDDNDPVECGRSCSPGTTDRVTDFDYLESGLLKKINGPRAPSAEGEDDITTVGDDPDDTDDPNCAGYNNQGLPLCIIDAEDNDKRFTHNGYGQTLSVTDREGRTTTNVYDPNYNLTSTYDAEGDRTRFTYDPNGNVTTETSPRGTETSASNDFRTVKSYDLNDRLTYVYEPGRTAADALRETDIDYYPDGSKQSIVSPAGHTTSFEYFANQQLKKVIAPATSSSTAETTITYDAAGRKKVVTFPSSGGGFTPTQEAFYSAGDTLVRIEETSAQSTSSSPRDRVTRFVFNAHGEQAQIVGPRVVDGVTAKQVNGFDSFGQMTSMKRLIRPNAAVEADKWLTHSYEYDKAGEQTKVTQPLGLPGDSDRTLTTDFTYDYLNQLVRQTDPQNPGDAQTGEHFTVFDYDKEGAQILREDRVAEPNAALIRSVTLAYNDDGSLRKKEYVAGDKQLSLCNWEKNAADQSSGYDADGNLLVSRSVQGPCTGDAISTKLFNYDHRGFMDELTQSVKLPSSPEVIRRQTLEYRADGALQKSHWKAMTRDANGGLVDVAGSNKTTSYTNSPAGWMTSIQDWRSQPVTSSFDYRPSGVMHSATLGDNITGSFTHHPQGSMSSLLWKKGTTELRKHSSMTYNLDDALVSENVAIEPTGSGTNDTGGAAVFGYDLANRLKSWTSPFAPTKKSDDQSTVAYHSYSLDDAGNILTENVGTTSGGTDISTTTSTYPNGRLDEQFQEIKARSDVDVLAATTKVEPAYSGIGDETTRTTTLTSDETPDATTVASRSSEYDAAGHTSKITDTATFYVDPPQGTPPALSPERVEYYYDADDQLIGRRHQKSGVNVRAFFYFLGGSHLAEEVEPSSGGGSAKVTYLNAVDGKAIAEQRNSDWIWLLRDPKGSIATRVKSGGDVVSQQAYDPYGDEDVGGTTFSSDTERDNPSSLGFQGSHTDQNTGNLLLGPRIYDPTIDRFTTADYFVGSMSDMQLGTDALTGNRYLFAAANPVAYYEDGHIPISTGIPGRAGGDDEDGLAFWTSFIISTPFIGDTIEGGMCLFGSDKSNCVGMFPVVGGIIKGGDNLNDMRRALDRMDDVSDAASDARRVWKVGDAIDAGGVSWTTARRRYWKTRAAGAADGEFYASDLERMQRGLAPLHPKYKVPMELHHRRPRSQGGSNSMDNLQEQWPWQHDRVDPYRHYRGPQP